jgi:hypothetical protein
MPLGGTAVNQPAPERMTTMDDPLNLLNVATPLPNRAQQVAPPLHLVNLYKRITTNPGADSLETRIVLLAHLVYMTYTDLKEHTAR